MAINICYEDVFGEELIRSLPEATLMLNLSNLAWYGDSLAQPQHLQIARVRALETGRPMLRSTNTGMTALVMPDGTVAAVLPPFRLGALRAAGGGAWLPAGWTPYGPCAGGNGLAWGWQGWPAGVCRVAAEPEEDGVSSRFAHQYEENPRTMRSYPRTVPKPWPA
ncbi:nitrilase-related carbon-nitrogen hydrolase [Zoogloea sp.]|uniref:nitrilase-related carbon-nitrogen hydrolase n=1 Tax=Zoogloea sp. TaxID=49181 RepID=UPI0025E19BC7|nr:nitrilase-related carbon-nitrogen hydrolase [Zoogloea sp.]